MSIYVCTFKMTVRLNPFIIFKTEKTDNYFYPWSQMNFSISCASINVLWEINMSCCIKYNAIPRKPPFQNNLSYIYNAKSFVEH